MDEQQMRALVKQRAEIGLIQGCPINHWEKLYFLSHALCGEVGELANKIKKQWRGDIIRPSPGDTRSSLELYDAWYVEVVSEIADVANYLDMLATHMNVDLLRAQYEKYLVVDARPEVKKRLKEVGIEPLTAETPINPRWVRP